jgi:hypothetical protein
VKVPFEYVLHVDCVWLFDVQAPNPLAKQPNETPAAEYVFCNKEL